MSITVFLADDHAVVRDGLRSLLEAQPDITVVGDAADGRQTLKLIEQLHPDVAIMDIAMPELNGIEAAGKIRLHHHRAGCARRAPEPGRAYRRRRKLVE